MVEWLRSRRPAGSIEAIILNQDCASYGRNTKFIIRWTSLFVVGTDLFGGGGVRPLGSDGYRPLGGGGDIRLWLLW